jgi:hypothetical protein
LPPPRTLGFEWGLVNTPNADERFAELVAHCAADDGAMQVLLPFEVAEMLRKAGLETGLQPPPEELPKRARALGCESYLTAELDCWRYSYVFLFSCAEIRYSLACRRANDGAVIWRVNVLKQARSVSDRKLARAALAETFRWLKGVQPAAEFCPAPEGGG